MKKVVMILLLILGINFFTEKQEKKEEELKGVYFSYIEISKYLKDKSEIESKKNIEKILTNIKEYGLNTIILHVRPSSDAIYQSDFFPLSIYLTEDGTYPYDVLDYFIKECKKKKIKLYAWINPYRISTTGTKEDITSSHPMYPYKDTDIIFEKNGLYLNPAREETNEIILKGVEEILNYDIDGIVMDDYFYPDKEVDKKEFEEYKKVNQNITLEEYHLENINKMVRSVHELCSKKNVLFGISPEGNIENNYEKNFADVKRWMKEEGYVDFIMPQLYYGFLNSTKPFVKTSNEWNELIEIEIPLYPVLAFYKVGKIDEYAKEGKEEWIKNDDIIRKEIIHSRTLKNYKGFVLYRYDSLFLEEEFTQNSRKEKESVKKIIN